MSLSLLVSARVGETRIALVDNGAVREIQLFRSLAPSLAGNIYLAFVRRLAPEFDGAFIELEPGLTAFLPARAASGAALTEGGKIPVQVKKDALGSKPPEASMKIELTSRSLQFRPLGKGIEISADIPRPQKQELAEYLQSLGPMEGGIRLRSTALRVSLATLGEELAAIRRSWAEIERAAAGLKSPRCLYRDSNPALAFIRDHGTESTPVLFDRADLLAEARQRLAPQAGLFSLYSGGDLFADFGVDAALDSLFATRLPLPGGGSLVIEETEALTAIDVNAGATSHNLAAAELHFHTNLEAAREIARQLRLRQLGGLIVVDFIDMADAAHARKLLRALDDHLADDPHPVRRTGFSAFGLIELTRKKIGPSLPRQLMMPQAAIPTLETSALRALALAETSGHKNPGRPLVIELDEATANWLLQNAAPLLAEVENRTASRVTLKPRSDFMPGQASAHSE